MGASQNESQKLRKTSEFKFINCLLLVTIRPERRQRGSGKATGRAAKQVAVRRGAAQHGQSEEKGLSRLKRL